MAKNGADGVVVVVGEKSEPSGDLGEVSTPVAVAADSAKGGAGVRMLEPLKWEPSGDCVDERPKEVSAAVEP